MSSYSIDPETGTYTRNQGTAMKLLREKLTEMYQIERIEFLSSGMNAIYTTLDSLALHFRKGIFLISKHLYSEVHGKIIKQLRRYHPKIRFVKVDIYESPPYIFENKEVKVLYLESCSNPHGYVFPPTNYSLLPDSAYVVVDNTWLSPVVYNPFVDDVDIVVESTAKYLSGGKCIMGLAAFKRKDDPIADLTQQYIKSTGIHANPIYCSLIVESLSNLKEKIKYSYTRTLKIIDYLRSESRIDIIHHPTLQSDITWMNYGPSVIYFHIQSPKRREDIPPAVIGAGIKYQTSFGHPIDTIDSWPQVDKTGIWLRLAVGYEDDPLIIEKLQNLIYIISA